MCVAFLSYIRPPNKYKCIFNLCVLLDSSVDIHGVRRRNYSTSGTNWIWKVSWIRTIRLFHNTITFHYWRVTCLLGRKPNSKYFSVDNVSPIDRLILIDLKLIVLFMFPICSIRINQCNFWKATLVYQEMAMATIYAYHFWVFVSLLDIFHPKESIFWWHEHHIIPNVWKRWLPEYSGRNCIEHTVDMIFLLIININMYRG